jgi:hypothetical protein
MDLPFRGEWSVLVAAFVVLALLLTGGCDRGIDVHGGNTVVEDGGDDGGGGGGGGGGGTPTPFQHSSITLRDVHGDPILMGSNVPYSPRRTCGVSGCHDVDVMANGYHFQQGRTDMDGNIVTKDDYFDDGRTFIKSAGMYGKW